MNRCNGAELMFLVKDVDIMSVYNEFEEISQPEITCSKLTIETLEHGEKYV